MADYIATTHSNDFRVQDACAFKAWCQSLNLQRWTKEARGDTYYAISDDSGHGWPNQRFLAESAETGDTKDVVDINCHAELAEQLDPRDIAVLIEIGNEKLRYVAGCAVAVHPDGRTHWVSTNDIYGNALKAFGDASLQITEATS